MTALDKAYELINGMAWKLGGVNGKLSVERVNGMTEVVHTATAGGRRSNAYKRVRRELGDDYTTTLSADGEAMQAIFAKVWPQVAHLAS